MLAGRDGLLLFGSGYGGSPETLKMVGEAGSSIIAGIFGQAFKEAGKTAQRSSGFNSHGLGPSVSVWIDMFKSDSSLGARCRSEYLVT